MEKVTGIRYSNSAVVPADSSRFISNTHIGQSFAATTIAKWVNGHLVRLPFSTLDGPSSSNTHSIHVASVTFLGTEKVHTGDTETILNSRTWGMFIDF